MGAALSATITWGAMFPVTSALLTRLDPFQVSAERYAIAAVVLLAILVLREGWGALSFAGRGRDVILLGLAGFTGFNILLLFGVRSAGPQHGALFMATFPALTMIVQSVRGRTFPPAYRVPFVLLAFIGVALVVTAGHGLRPASILGDLSLIAAALCWVAYTIGSASLRGWSPLRFTALSATSGALALVIVALAATALGLSKLPSRVDYVATAPSIAFLALVAGVFGVLAWTTAVQGLGAQRTALFSNVVPVTTFGVTALLGYRPHGLEIAGAALTILALIGDNVTTALRSRVQSPIAESDLAAEHRVTMGSGPAAVDPALALCARQPRQTAFQNAQV
jgi:drug/metabolite transporter (DMT)-like permease